MSFSLFSVVFAVYDCFVCSELFLKHQIFKNNVAIPPIPRAFIFLLKKLRLIYEFSLLSVVPAVLIHHALRKQQFNRIASFIYDKSCTNKFDVQISYIFAEVIEFTVLVSLCTFFRYSLFDLVGRYEEQKILFELQEPESESLQSLESNMDICNSPDEDSAELLKPIQIRTTRHRSSGHQQHHHQQQPPPRRKRAPSDIYTPIGSIPSEEGKKNNSKAHNRTICKKSNGATTHQELSVDSKEAAAATVAALAAVAAARTSTPVKSNQASSLLSPMKTSRKTPKKSKN